MSETLASKARPGDHPPSPPIVEGRGVGRRFGDNEALVDVDFAVHGGEIHALLGRNGAGKTTLLRILIGLHDPTAGTVRLPMADLEVTSREARQLLGFVPSGDRSFYNRISGFENLLFFARLHGLPRRPAAARARELLDQVGLSDAARRPVGQYSHGMQKRLGVARGLLTEPQVLLLDEATHDLDPEGAERVRAMVVGAARGGTAVVWTTQRVDEIRGFAHRVTVLDRGCVRFAGSVPQLLAVSPTHYYEVRVTGRDGSPTDVDTIAGVVGDAAVVRPSADPQHVVIEVAEGAILGDVLASIASAGFRILACREERSEVEQALLRLGNGESPL